MVSFFSRVNVKRVLFAGLVLVLLAGFLGGCKNEVEDVNEPGSLPSGLVGKWVTDYDSFEITTSTIKYDGGGYGDYAGNIRFVSNYDSKSGVIIVQYTTGAPDAAKPFHAIYYLNFTPGVSVELNNTWDATRDDYNADTATLDAAKEKFTKGKMGDWIDVSYSTPYTKQN